MKDIVVIDSPLRCVFITPNTPGSRIPSHGTSNYGETYAIDFVVVSRSGKSKKPYGPGVLKYLFRGLRLDEFYGWSESIYAPVAGEIVRVVDGIRERNPVNLFRDIRNTIRVTRKFEEGKEDFTAITGNCVIIQYGVNEYCLLAHLKTGSVIVEEGQRIERNQPVGELGHSGNSTMPHLHMQFMNSLDFRKAQGIPFKLKEYYVYRKGEWIRNSDAVPTDKEIIRVGWNH